MTTALDLIPAERGFQRANFLDLNGQECSIQESSLATENAIWLGCDTGLHHQGECLARMHLNQEQVAALLPLLASFVQHGHLPQADGQIGDSKHIILGDPFFPYFPQFPSQ